MNLQQAEAVEVGMPTKHTQSMSRESETQVTAISKRKGVSLHRDVRNQTKKCKKRCLNGHAQVYEMRGEPQSTLCVNALGATRCCKRHGLLRVLACALDTPRGGSGAVETNEATLMADVRRLLHRRTTHLDGKSPGCPPKRVSAGSTCVREIHSEKSAKQNTMKHECARLAQDMRMEPTKTFQ